MTQYHVTGLEGGKRAEASLWLSVIVADVDANRMCNCFMLVVLGLGASPAPWAGWERERSSKPT